MKRLSDTVSRTQRHTARALGPGRADQAGAVLVVSLILLVVLTLLGLSAMNFTSLEHKMAANTQEGYRAFQAAETGLTDAMDNVNSLDLSNPVTVDFGTLGATPASVSYSTGFRGWSPPPLGSLYSASSFSAAHFNVQSPGRTTAGAAVVLDGGMFQIAPKGL